MNIRTRSVTCFTQWTVGDTEKSQFSLADVQSAVLLLSCMHVNFFVSSSLSPLINNFVDDVL